MTLAFQVNQTSNYGTSTPAVARTFLQGRDIVQFFGGTKAQREGAESILMELCQKLVRCVAIHHEVESAVEAAQIAVEKGELCAGNEPRVLRPPSIPDLQVKAESFLQGAKLAIGEATRLIEPFYGKHFAHKLDKFARWAQSTFGESHPLVEFARTWKPWVRHVLAMRNVVDHPRGGPRGRLVTMDFRFEVHGDALRLFPPRWGLTGDELHPMSVEMGSIIEGVVSLQEHLLAALLFERRVFPVVLREIPATQRRSECPIRFVVAFGPEAEPEPPTETLGSAPAQRQ